jgi:hypothetical protein
MQMEGIRELGFCALCASPVFGFDDTEQPLIHGTCSQVREDAARECFELATKEAEKWTRYKGSNYQLNEVCMSIATAIKEKFGLEI